LRKQGHLWDLPKMNAPRPIQDIGVSTPSNTELHQGGLRR
jgi:hypothetical protein